MNMLNMLKSSLDSVLNRYVNFDFFFFWVLNGRKQEVNTKTQLYMQTEEQLQLQQPTFCQ